MTQSEISDTACVSLTETNAKVTFAPQIPTTFKESLKPCFASVVCLTAFNQRYTYLHEIYSSGHRYRKSKCHFGLHFISPGEVDFPESRFPDFTHGAEFRAAMNIFR